MVSFVAGGAIYCRGEINLVAVQMIECYFDVCETLRSLVQVQPLLGIESRNRSSVSIIVPIGEVAQLGERVNTCRNHCFY